MSFRNAYNQFSSPVVGDQLTIRAKFLSQNGSNITLITESGIVFVIPGTDSIAPCTAGQLQAVQSLSGFELENNSGIILLESGDVLLLEAQ